MDKLLTGRWEKPGVSKLSQLRLNGSFAYGGCGCSTISSNSLVLWAVLLSIFLGSSHSGLLLSLVL